MAKLPVSSLRDSKFLLTISEQVQSSDLKEAAKVFGVSFERVLVLEFLPVRLVKLATYEAFLQAQAQFELFGGLFKDNVTEQQLDQIPAMVVEIEKRTRPWWNAQADRMSSYATELVKRNLFSGTARAEAQRAAHTLYIAIMLNTWTAFEALATDLWVAAVNARTKLAENAMIKKIDGLPDIEEQKQRLPLDEFKEYQYIFSDKMGTLLKKKERFNFNRLDGLNRAYAAIFRDQSAYLSHQKEWESLRELEALRNVFVHHGGFADAVFKDENLPPKSIFHNVPIGHGVVLDGPKLAQLVMATGAVCLRLLEQTDGWLVAHPQPKVK